MGRFALLWLFAGSLYAQAWSLNVPASAAVVVAPMQLAGGVVTSLEATNLNGGVSSASASFTHPASGPIFVWVYVQSSSGNDDSFWVSLDGGTEDVFDTGTDCGGINGPWNWKKLNGRAGGGACAVNPRFFGVVSAGIHVLKFRAREQGSRFAAVWLADSSSAAPPIPSPTPFAGTPTPTRTATVTPTTTPTLTPIVIPTMTLPQNLNYLNTRVANIEKTYYCETCECPTCPTRTPLPTPAP